MAREILYRVCYGSSNVSHDPFKAKFAASLSIKNAILHDYCRHKVDRADYPGIIPEKGRTVRGTYVTGLTEHDIQLLDWFEGSEYTRQQVAVSLLEADAENNLVEGSEVQTETYVFTAGRDQLETAEWDYEVFRREKIHRWADLSGEYDGIMSFLECLRQHADVE